MENMENKSYTGLDLAEDRHEAEYDLVTALLEAAAYKTDVENITEVEIKRNGKYLFSVHIHPISDNDLGKARREAGIYKTNPQNKKLGRIKVDTDRTKLSSWIIYLATTEADQERIWGNTAIMGKFGLMQPWESIDILLKSGEKDALLEQVLTISDMMDDDEEDQVADDEMFQS